MMRLVHIAHILHGLTTSMAPVDYKCLKTYVVKPAIAKVQLRIVEMLRKGELDPNLAMQLLGGGLADATEPSVDGKARDELAKKRPREGDDGGESPNGIHDDSGLDDLLDQAMKAKKDALF